MHSFSGSHNGQFPVTDRESDSVTKFSGGGGDHVSWVSGAFYNTMADDYGIRLKDFQCPNRPDTWTSGATLPDGTATGRWRVSYYMMFGRDISKYGRRATWNSPINDSSDPRLVATADITEQGTVDPPSSSASHGDTGIIYVSGSQDPADFGSAGSNIGFVNGSVQWTPQENMVRHQASTGGSIRGYWTQTLDGLLPSAAR